MRGQRVRLAGVLVVVLLVASGCDWLQTGFDAGESAFNPVEPALTPSTVANLSQRFTLSSAGRSYGAPIVAAGTLYATSINSPVTAPSTARLEAFGATDGAPRWSTTLTADTTSVTDPVYANDTIYAATTTTLYAVAPETGAVKWTLALPEAVASPPGLAVASPGLTVDQGKIFLVLSNGKDPGVVAALDGSTGATLWTASATFLCHNNIGQPMLIDGLVAIPGLSSQDCLHPVTALFNEADGSPAANPSAGLWAMVAANHLLYGLRINDALAQWEFLAVNASTGTMAWSGGTLGQFTPSGLGVAVTEHSAVWGGCCSDAADIAEDATTGQYQWETPIIINGVAVYTSGVPVIAGDVVYIVHGTTLATYDLATGAPLGSVALPPWGSGGTPRTVVADGTVYVTVNGTIVAFSPA